MRSLGAVAAAAAILIPSVCAAAGPGTMQLDFHKRKVAARASTIVRRQTSKTVNVAIDNEEILYLINCTVGTPGQSISLQLDTGSSDIWFPAASSSYCVQQGCPVGSYDSSTSSTYEPSNFGTFEIQYVDGTTVQGDYITDVLSIGGTQVTNLTMAQATQTGDQGFGIMGIGFAADESSDNGEAGAFTYPNIIDVLVSQGKINTRSYSLWLDDLDSNTGSILFGGVDKSKYTGDLIAIPVQKDSQSGNYTSFTVAWTGLTLTGGGKTYDESPSSPSPAILDSGTTDTLLPDEIANNIFNGFGVISDQSYGNIVPCSLANDSMTFTFAFGGTGGPRIDVPLSEFVVPLLTQSGQQPRFRSGQYAGQAACSFGIEAAGTAPILFGDTFLRSAYVVYDLDNLEIGMAQTNRNSNTGESDVKAFTSGSGMPDATTTVAAVTVSAASVSLEGPNVRSTASYDGDAGAQATQRTATFALTTSSSTSSKGASASSIVPPIERSVFTVLSIAAVSFLFGTMLL